VRRCGVPCLRKGASRLRGCGFPQAQRSHHHSDTRGGDKETRPANSYVSPARHRHRRSRGADLPKVLDLAKRKNAVIKVSGACTLSREPYPFPDIWDPLARVFDAWGFDRCLWGTDWTRAYAVVNYEQAVVPSLKTDRLSDSERAMLMGGACTKAYRWSPKKG
jgi:hypothetical protein